MKSENPSDFFAQGEAVAVLTTQPLDKLLDYRAPEGGVVLGDFVEVPLGPRRVLGVVWDKAQGAYDSAKLRSMFRVLDLPPMPPDMRQFIERAAQYTLTPLDVMLRLATRAPELMKDPKTRKLYKKGEGALPRVTPAREAVLSTLAENPGAALMLSELAQLSGVSNAVVKGMVASGAVHEFEAPRDLPFDNRLRRTRDRPLSTEQSAAAAPLVAAVKAQKYETFLLHGITGSGKTEVYLEAIAEAVNQGRQALVLLPEIALSSTFIERIWERFGVKPAQWHSGVSQTERRRVWKMVGQHAAPIVIGARSALFLPFADLGLVVVDEEHDSSYKQEDGARYHARDMAVLRASLCDAPAILASATPSLETWVNAQNGKYKKITLAERFGPAHLPDLSALDLRHVAMERNTWIAPQLAQMADAALAQGEQVLFFLNRRGYAPVTLCRACGHQFSCQQCDARLVEHRFFKKLLCHMCGADHELPQKCPECGRDDRLAVIGPGIERLAEEVTRRFPDARLMSLSSDMFGSARALKEQIERIARGEADIIVGTQLVAKGHNFPKLTLVGVIDADLGLHGSDLRAAERTFQLMRQVSGRAGRAERPGTCVLQTSQPDHPVIHALLSGDDHAFLTTQSLQREALLMPPYGRLAAVILSGPDERSVLQLGQSLALRAGALKAHDIRVFGPAPAPIARIKNMYRFRMLLQAARSAPLQMAIAQWLAPIRHGPKERIIVDIDPQSFY